MISHPVREVVLTIGSLQVYYLWESPSEEIPIKKNFYWHDKFSTSSEGPFGSVSEALRNYANTKRAVDHSYRSVNRILTTLTRMELI